MAKQSAYGWTYDKQGNVKQVSAPVYSNGKSAKKPQSTQTGALLGGVGFSMNLDRDQDNDLYERGSE